MASEMAFVDVIFDGGLLRPWGALDASKLVEAWSDPDIARWNQVPPVPTRATADRWIAGWQSRFDNKLAVDLVVVAAVNAAVVGEVGLSSFADVPGGGRGALVGYWLLPEARGQGLATAAVQACVRWARADLGLTIVAARCHADNLDSQRVAVQAGFEYERDDAAGNQLWFSRPRDH